MILEMEWQIPWAAEWDEEKKAKAADKLVEYLTSGTVYETKNRRMKVTKAEAVLIDPANPYIAFTLEG